MLCFLVCVWFKAYYKISFPIFCFGGDTIKKGDSERVHCFTGGTAGFGGHAWW